jgi:type VI secretion system protein ImpE
MASQPEALGRLTETLRVEGPAAAFASLKQDVRKAPREPRLRTFLFQMFCLYGEWDRAINQLSVLSELDPLALPMAHTYRSVIRCEMLRERVFAGRRSPTVMGEPEQWFSLLTEANRVLAEGSSAEASGLRDAAFEAAPAISGTIDGRPFEWIADADPRLGPVLEVMVEERYLWVPFHRMARIDIETPADLRDQIWLPAHFTWTTGGQSFGFIPTRYPGSDKAGDDLAMAKRTEWRHVGAGPDDASGWDLGLGQRMLATDAEDVAIMDVRRIEFAAVIADGTDEPDSHTASQEPTG